MPEITLRSDAVNVEALMEQIRARIREKRGVDYTEAEVRELASVKLQKFLDPRGVRSGLLEQYRAGDPAGGPLDRPNYVFSDRTLFDSTRAPLRALRRLLLPILKLFFNPNPLIQALHIQSQVNEMAARRDTARHALDQLNYEVMHNLVLEMTRLGIENQNLKMRVESLASRLEFNERRARALEGLVAHPPEPAPRTPVASRQEPPRASTPQPPRSPMPIAGPSVAASVARSTPSTADTAPEPAEGALEGAQAPGDALPAEGPGQRSRRRRRRRGRRGTGSAAAAMTSADGSAEDSHAASDRDTDTDGSAADDTSESHDAGE